MGTDPVIALIGGVVLAGLIFFIYKQWTKKRDSTGNSGGGPREGTKPK
jgi:hypothetical protein